MDENAKISSPLEWRKYRSIPPKTGVAKVEMANTKTKTHTMMEGLPVIYTILSVNLIPIKEPRRDHKPIQTA